MNLAVKHPEQLHVMCVGAATQDVFLEGDILTPQNEHGQHFIEIKLGDKLYLDKATFTTGGNACNAAVTFARAGIHSSFVGAVGDDAAGQAVMEVLNQELIDTSCTTIMPGLRTGYSVILLAPSGERTILRVKGETEADMGHKHFFNTLDCDWIYLSSVGSIELTKKVIDHAADQGVKIAFNPGTLDLKQPKDLKELLPKVELLFLNKQEMSLLFEGETTEELAKAAGQVVKVAVVSDGPNGVVVCDQTNIYTAGMYEDVPVIDRLGAGDAFGSGFTSSYIQNGSIVDAIIYGSANSTSVVQSIGAKAGIIRQGYKLHSMPIKTESLMVN